MSEQLDDLKLKKLVELCLRTLNYKKLAVVVFTLISNRMDEIGVNLGIKPRNKDKGEKIYSYMSMINEILQINFNISLFEEEMIETIRRIEIIFLRKRGELSKPQIKSIFAYYYKLRQLEVPNVYQTIDNEYLSQNPKLKLLSFLSGHKEDHHQDRIYPFIIQKIREEERQAETLLQSQFDPELFEKVLKLKSLRNSLERHKSGKIIVQRTLKDNINYIRSKDNLVLYLLVSWVMLLGMIGVVIIIETIFFPQISIDISPYLLLVLGPIAILILLYRNYRKSRGGI
jgi:hypothetical protein